MDKYGIDFPTTVRQEDSVRLINQLWKLIPMREHNEDWLSHWRVMLEEITGLTRLYKDKTESLILLAKLEGLNSPICDEDFMTYRYTVFKCIDLLSKVLKDE